MAVKKIFDSHFYIVKKLSEKYRIALFKIYYLILHFIVE